MAAAGDASRTRRNVADTTHDLYRQYGKQIYAYCLHQLRSREEAEDAVQTTFLNAFRGLQRGTTTRFEQAWLYKIAHNVCIARRSSSGRRLKVEAPDDFEILQEIVPAGANRSETDTLELMGLDEALDSMPENQRRAILLREWQGFSYREIADELGLSQGAVEMLIFRARRTLATALEQPEVTAKRRTSKAKTGFSFGSLIAAMKSLFSGGVALKMAAVAASAAVVGTNTVHSIVRRALAPHVHAQRTALHAPVSHGSTPTSSGSTQPVSFTAARTHARVPPTSAAQASAVTGGSLGGTAALPIEDVASVAAPASAPTEPAPAPADASQHSGSPSNGQAPVAPPAQPSSPPPPPSGEGDGGGGQRGGPPMKAPSPPLDTGPPTDGSGSSAGTSGDGTWNGGNGRHGDRGHGKHHDAAESGAPTPGNGGDPGGPTTTPIQVAPPYTTMAATIPTDTTTTVTTTTDTTTTADTTTTESTTATETTPTTITPNGGDSSSSSDSGRHHGGGDGNGGDGTDGGHGHHDH